MYTDTEGIILKQVKAVNGRRMVLLFSKKYGKISAGTGINEKGRNKSALALRPFTYGKYELFKGRETYNINGAETIKSYYRLGEDVDKYMCSSYALEFTDKILAEDQPVPELFNLLLDFLAMMEEREKKQETLVIGYEVKALALLGFAPQLDACARCGRTGPASAFSVKDGGVLCEDCRNNMDPHCNESLIYNVNFGIVDVLRYFFANPLRSLEKIALNDSMQTKLMEIIKSYAGYHLDMGELKSEGFLSGMK